MVSNLIQIIAPTSAFGDKDGELIYDYSLSDQVSFANSGNFTAMKFFLPGPMLISPRQFWDQRGGFIESFSARLFADLGIIDEFLQENQSSSICSGTVRGLHFQLPPHTQAKLVRVVRGRIIDVAVDARRSSPHFGHHIAVDLSAENSRILYIPGGFAHGFCTLEPDTVVAYKATDYYAPGSEGGFAWDDPDIAIRWPVTPDAALLSDKDRRLPRLADNPPCFA